MLGTHQDVGIGVSPKMKKRDRKIVEVNKSLFISGDQTQNFFDLNKNEIKIILELFQEVPVGAIETLFNYQNQPLFKRADLGKYLGIKNIGDNFKDFPSHYTSPRLRIEVGGLTTPLGRTKNLHDVFINLDGCIEMAIQSKKPNALVK